MAAAASRRGLFALHVAVLLFGMAGLFAKLVSTTPLAIVAGRTLFAALALGLMQSRKGRFGIRRARKDLPALAGMGILLALHWWTFFHAIQISTVAVGLLGYAAFPMFVTFLEPYFFKEPFRRIDLVTAVAITIGLAAVAWPIELSAGRTLGVLWGIISGLMFALLSLGNRRYVQKHSPIAMACLQNGFAFLALAPLLLLSPPYLSWTDIAWLLILGLLCTALAHALFIHSLATVRAQLAGVIAALEPVYGIVFAFFLLGESPAVSTMLGGSLIILATGLAMFYKAPPAISHTSPST